MRGGRLRMVAIGIAGVLLVGALLAGWAHGGAAPMRTQEPGSSGPGKSGPGRQASGAQRPGKPTSGAQTSEATAASVPLSNGDFEGGETAEGAPTSWTLGIGATNGGTQPQSIVELDRDVKHGGQAALHLAGDARVRAWRTLSQDLEARPGAAYRLSGWARTKKVAPEAVAGTNLVQRGNAYAGLFFLDAGGAVVAREVTTVRAPTADWHEWKVEVAAPDSAVRVQITLFLSMSGDLWFDDLALTAAGGRALPAPELLFSEGFETAKELPATWWREIGAARGDTSAASKVLLGQGQGAPGSPNCLVLDCYVENRSWWWVGRTVDVVPGDVLELSCWVKADDVRKEGDEFENFHVNLGFRDAEGRAVGTLTAQSCGKGTFDWKEVQVRATAPAGATTVRAGFFLSMTGRACFDRIVLTRRAGARPAYDGWVSAQGRHVVVRHAPDHPRAREMRGYVERLDATYETIRKRLGTRFDDVVTVYLYADKAEGERLTGRPLAFAAPSEHAVHQTMDNTIGHELTHVIALGVGYAQVPLFGEGIAVWLDGDTDDAHHDRAAELLREGKLPTLEFMLARFREDEAVTYPASGSFTGFVVATCGLEAFRRVYVAPDPVAAAPQMLGRSLAELDAAWRAFLAQRGK